MPRRTRSVGPQSVARLVLLACSLIAATALAALLVMVIDAKAQTTRATSLVCPPDDRGRSAPPQIRAGVRNELVPPGATTLTVCDYNGMNAFGGAPQWALRGAGATADRSLINRIVAELDALRPVHGVYSCPMDDGSADVATFGYGSPPGVVVTMGTNGCNSITNGHVTRQGLDKPVVSQIKALAKAVSGLKWATVRGHLSVCGGPAPGGCHIQNYDRSDRVVVSGANGLWLAMATIEHGRFAFRVASSGTYTFSFYAGNRLVRELRRSVRVGQTTSVVFPISIP